MFLYQHNGLWLDFTLHASGVLHIACLSLIYRHVFCVWLLTHMCVCESDWGFSHQILSPACLLVFLHLCSLHTAPYAWAWQVFYPVTPSVWLLRAWGRAGFPILLCGLCFMQRRLDPEVSPWLHRVVFVVLPIEKRNNTRVRKMRGERNISENKHFCDIYKSLVTFFVHRNTLRLGLLQI